MMGPFRLTATAGAVIPIVSRRARGLLAYLALTPEGSETRERLCELLWSDRGDAQARASLRQCLLELRSTLESAGLEVVNAERETIGLAAGAVVSDVADLRATVADGAVETLLARLVLIGPKRLLEDLDIGGRFETWLEQTRAELDRAIAEQTLSTLKRLEAAADWPNVRALADAYLRRDPLDEAVTAAAIRADGALGAISGAHRRFETLKAGLARQFRTQPGPAVRAAIAEIGPAAPVMDASRRARERTEQRFRRTDRLLAVLPFDNLSADREMDFFSDGVSEEIQRTVGRVADLKVVGRTSSFQFRGPDKAVKRVAQELNATHVLDGSVHRQGDRVRIFTQLIECEGQTTLWSERFDRDLTNLFAVQDEIAAAPARIDAEGYDLYLKARSTFPWGDLSDDPRIPHLQKAVTLAPQLAPAWATLAAYQAWNSRVSTLDAATTAAIRAQVTHAAETALELDPRSGYAYVALSYLEAWGRYAAHETLLEKAIAVAPGATQPLIAMSQFLFAVGRNHEALQFASEAIVLDPLHQHAAGYYAGLLSTNGQAAESRRAFDTFRARWPGHPELTNWPLHIASFSDDWERYDELLGIAQKLDLMASVGEAVRVGKMLRNPAPWRKQALIAFIGEEIRKTGTTEFAPLMLGCKLGLADEVFALIEQASFAHLFDETGPPPAGEFLPGVIFDPILNGEMARDVRFVAFCGKIGLCDYWLQTDRWPDLAHTAPYDLKAEARRLTSNP
jgi:TolB-like protein